MYTCFCQYLFYWKCQFCTKCVRLTEFLSNFKPKTTLRLSSRGVYSCPMHVKYRVIPPWYLAKCFFSISSTLLIVKQLEKFLTTKRVLKDIQLSCRIKIKDSEKEDLYFNFLTIYQVAKVILWWRMLQIV